MFTVDVGLGRYQFDPVRSWLFVRAFWVVCLFERDSSGYVGAMIVVRLLDVWIFVKTTKVCSRFYFLMAVVCGWYGFVRSSMHFCGRSECGENICTRMGGVFGTRS